MPRYWCTFRLAADKTYRARYETLLQAVFALSAKGSPPWTELSSYVALETPLDLADAAAQLCRAIDHNRDLIVVGRIGSDEVVYGGVVQRIDVFAALFPGARKLA